MIKLINILKEVTNKNDKLNTIRKYFYDCLDEFYPEYKQYTNQFTPKFEIKNLRGAAGHCKSTRRNGNLINIEIVIQDDFSSGDDVTKSVVYHETIHYMQDILIEFKLEPYIAGYIRGDYHDKFFMSELERMNKVLGNNFVTRTEDRKDLEGAVNRFIYIIRYSDEVYQAKSKLNSNSSRYLAATSIKENIRDFKWWIKNYKDNGTEFYIFNSKKILWKVYPTLADNMATVRLNGELFKEIEDKINSGEAKLIDSNEENTEYIYIYGYINKTRYLKGAVYSSKPNPEAKIQAIEKVKRYSKLSDNYDEIDDVIYFEFKTLNPDLLSLQKFIKNKSFKYRLKSTEEEYINDVLNGKIKEPEVTNVIIEKII
jgi:hypothetical protein